MDFQEICSPDSQLFTPSEECPWITSGDFSGDGIGLHFFQLVPKDGKLEGSRFLTEDLVLKEGVALDALAKCYFLQPL